MKLTICQSSKQRGETWERWFAWHPVFAESAADMTGCVLIWLQDVERKEAMGYSGWEWRHREIV